MHKWMICSIMLAGLAVAQADEITLKIEGMSCPQGCVTRVDQALAKVKGVTCRKVELGKAVVTYDAKKTSKDALVKAIEKAGYKVAAN